MWALAAAALGAPACGGAEERSAAPEGIRLAAPTRPATADCAARQLATAATPEGLAPAPGSYRYRTEGTRTLSGERSRVRRLPSRTTIAVTGERRIGNLRCFRVQRRYARALGDTATFVIRGSDIYLTGLLLQVGGDLSEIAPDRPVLFLSGDELEWSGRFEGTTRGRYAASVIGRRTMKVGTRRVRAVGVEIRLSFAGEVRGTARLEQWISPDRNLVIAEKVEQRRSYGLDRLRLDYSSRLASLRPS